MSAKCRRARGIGASVEHWASKTSELRETRWILVPPPPWVRFRARMFDIALWDTCVAILFFPRHFRAKWGKWNLICSCCRAGSLWNRYSCGRLGSRLANNCSGLGSCSRTYVDYVFASAFSEFQSVVAWGMGFVLVVAFTLPHAKSVLTRDSINMTSLRLCILVSSLGGRWNG